MNSGLENVVFIKDGENDHTKCFSGEKFLEHTGQCYELRTAEKKFNRAREKCLKGRICLAFIKNLISFY